VDMEFELSTIVEKAVDNLVGNRTLAVGGLGKCRVIGLPCLGRTKGMRTFYNSVHIFWLFSFLEALGK